MAPADSKLPFASDAEAAAWCARTRRASLRRRRAAFAELARVFQAAPAPESIAGNTDIGLVAAPLGLPVDAVVRLFFNTGFWLHKKFDAGGAGGSTGSPAGSARSPRSSSPAAASTRTRPGCGASGSRTSGPRAWCSPARRCSPSTTATLRPRS
ncbi:hypothetical protein [Segniliparus rugosus]|uniref:hypothetical protein n=1 Tax=Segniliparus rugosus TaxID=286804 RepID=UPI001FCAD580|nr:hypothetical protein [Segniliparus rugosus]